MGGTVSGKSEFAESVTDIVDEIVDRNNRIRQLEKQCASLAAEVDRCRPVMEAAVNRVGTLRQIHPDGLTTDEIQLVSAVTIYEASNPK